MSLHQHHYTAVYQYQYQYNMACQMYVQICLPVSVKSFSISFSNELLLRNYN